MKNTFILLGILAGLAIVAFFLMQQPGEQSTADSERPRLVPVDSASVTGITITSPAAAVELTKRGVDWFIAGPPEYKADPAGVGTFLGQVQGLTVKSVISSNPEKRGLFQVDSTGTRVTLRQEGRVEVFIIGKSGPSYADVYARRDESDEVVLVDAAISYSTNRPLKDWRDHTIMNVPKEQLREINFQYGDTTFSLIRNDSAWVVGGGQVQDWVANNLVTTLSNFKADDFVDSPPSPQPKLVAIVSCSDIQLRFYQSKGSDKFFVQTSTSPQWFQIEGWKANQVLKRKKELTASG